MQKSAPKQKSAPMQKRSSNARAVRSAAIIVAPLHAAHHFNTVIGQETIGESKKMAPPFCSSQICDLIFSDSFRCRDQAGGRFDCDQHEPGIHASLLTPPKSQPNRDRWVSKNSIMTCHDLAKRLSELQPELSQADIARLALMIFTQSADPSELADDAALMSAWKNATFRLEAASDQHAAVAEELDLMCSDGPVQFSPAR